MGSVRFRMYVAGQLVRQETAEVTAGEDLKTLAEVHSTWLVQRAGTDPWLVEVELLSDPTDPDRFIRFGTDNKGMVDPHPLFG